jgi:DNA end-binding protein Ku
MARPTWRGTVNFGLVNVPVALFTAVRSQDVRFRQVNKDTGQPVRQQRVDQSTGEVVAYEDIVKGYELPDGRLVVVDPDELAELDPRATRLIEIHDFVQQEEIDPVHYDRAYYLAPDGDAAGKPYLLLAQAMERSDRVAIARLVMRGKEHLAAIRAHDGLLVLSTMHYADEVADPREMAPDAFDLDVTVRDRELDMAEQLIASMTGEFTPDRYENEYRQRVLSYIAAKAEGDEVAMPTDDRAGGEVIDLMAALERSLERAASAGREQDAGGESGTGREGDTEASAGDGGDTGNGEAVGYADMTRAELYELAQERKLPGRSRMSKDELAEALATADAGAA